jgi:hypothetical protein
MSAADASGLRLAVAGMTAQRSGPEHQRGTSDQESQATGFLQVLSGLAAETPPEAPPELPQARLAMATGTSVALAFRQLSASDGDEQPELVGDGQAPPSEAAPAALPAAWADVAAALSPPLPALPVAAGDAGALVAEPTSGAVEAGRGTHTRSPQGADGARVAGPKPDPAVASADFRVLGVETHVAPVAGAPPPLQRAASLEALRSVANEAAASVAPRDAEDGQAPGGPRPATKDAWRHEVRRGASSRPDEPQSLGTTPATDAAAHPRSSRTTGGDVEAQDFGPVGRPASGRTDLAGAPEPQATSAPGSTLQQLSERIAGAVAESESSFDPAGVAHAKIPVPSAVKVLAIALEPVALGTVSVRLALRNDALHVEISAERPETARLLHRDREALASLLQASGIATDAVVVLSRPQDASGAATGGGAGWPQLGQQQQAASGFAEPDARSFGRQSQAGREQKTPQPSGKSDDEIGGTRAGGSLYV